MNYNNGTSPNYGCATNSNLAAMIANPEDLIEGQKGTGETVIMSSSKAIETYRDAAPTGAGGLSENATGGN
jgi:pilus assembly protein CpaD